MFNSAFRVVCNDLSAIITMTLTTTCRLNQADYWVWITCGRTHVSKKITWQFNFPKTCIWSEPVTSPVQGGTRHPCGCHTDLPDGIHSICGMTFCSIGTQGHRVAVQTAGRVLRCASPPWDTAAEWDAHHSLALQMHLTTARLSASLGLDQIHTEECSLGLSLQPPCDAHSHARTQSHLESFLKGANFISGKMWRRGIYFYSFVCWMRAGEGR